MSICQSRSFVYHPLHVVWRLACDKLQLRRSGPLQEHLFEENYRNIQTRNCYLWIKIECGFFSVGGGKLWCDQYGSRDDFPKKCGHNTTRNRFYATSQAGHLQNRGGNEGALLLFYTNGCLTSTTDHKIRLKTFQFATWPPNTGRQFDDFRCNWKIGQNFTR